MAKRFTSPALIGLASLAGRRWGLNVAGLMGGLPLVGGPVVLVLWLTQGSAYATDVALAATVGVWANIVYMLVYGYASTRFTWPGALLLAWLGYIGSGLLLDWLGVAGNLWLGLAVVPGLWIAAVRWLPQPRLVPVSAHLPRIELFARMGAAALLVLSLTGVSTALGPTLTGIFTGAPVAAMVIPSFTFANAGRDALLLVLRGFLTGLMGFVVCFLLLGYLIPLLAGVSVGLLATQLAKRAS
jgi:hypothetical protein